MGQVWNYASHGSDIGQLRATSIRQRQNNLEFTSGLDVQKSSMIQCRTMRDNKHPRTEIDLPADVVGWVLSHFSGDEYGIAISTLVTATIHTGEHPSDRLIRSAAIGSKGNLENLQYLVQLLAIDWRDVIVAGEYEPVNHELIRVRDLSTPILADTDRNSVPENS